MRKRARDTQIQEIQAFYKFINYTNKISDQNLELKVVNQSVRLQPDNVREITIKSKINSDKVVKMICELKMPQLQVLNLDKGQITCKGMKCFQEVKWPKLNTFTMGLNLCDDEGISFLLADGQKFSEMRNFRICSNTLGMKAIDLIVNSNWPNLETLNLSDNEIGSKEIGCLKKGNWPELKQLNLNYNHIGVRGCINIGKGKWLKIQNLFISATRIGTQGMRLLCTLGNWANLKSLDLSGNEIQCEGLHMLCKTNWTHLQTLNLEDNRISNQGVKYLIQAEFIKLKILFLGFNLIKDRGALSLRDSNWPALERITLSGNSMTVKGVSHLFRAYWPELRQLSLHKVCEAKEQVLQLVCGGWLKLNWFSHQSDLVEERLRVMMEKRWEGIKII